jgi:hypothetical protein
MLFNQLNHDFFQNPPLVDEGLCMPNKEAGLRIDKTKKELIMDKLHNGLFIKKPTLREQLIDVKDYTKGLRSRKHEYIMEIKRKHEINRMM